MMVNASSSSCWDARKIRFLNVNTARDLLPIFSGNSGLMLYLVL
jgi:hypothetical protein